MNIKRQKIIGLIFAIMIFAVSSYFILGEIFLPADKLDGAYVCTEFQGEWERITAEGIREPVKVPGKCEAERNEVIVIETKLPGEIGHNSYLCFRSAKQDMRFYIDGKFRQEYSTKENRLFGRMSAVAYVFLEISGKDAGKTLRLETQTDSAYSGMFYTVYYGNPMGMWNRFLKQLGLELAVAFVTLILSIIAIIGSIALRFFYHKKVALEYLGWGILVAAVWLITNSAFRQLIFPNLSVINDITFLMIMLLSLPYLLYMNEVQKGRYGQAYHIMESIVIFNFVVCSGLHMTGLRDFTDTIKYISVFCVLSIALMVATIISDLRKGYIREYPYVAVGMSGVCIAAFIQIIIYFYRINLFNGLILAVGLIFLLIFSTISTVQEIIYMEQEKQKALQISNLKDRFLANMSHEIRTPINAVLGMDAMILRESREEQIREYALDIQNAGQTLLSLINDILDISKIESGKLELIPVDYDVSSLIYDIMNMIGMKAQDKGLKLNLFVDERLPSRLWGDDVRIRQVLVNLLNNAVKYTEKGSVTLKVDAAVAEGFADITFRVEDTGIGIREEDMEKLFREFERIEEQRNRKIEGTGLGMSITVQLLGRMESKLQVESVYGKGSVFSFTLKQKIMSDEPIGNLEQRIQGRAAEYSYQAMFTAPDARLLIVDDNALNRRVFMNLLKSTRMIIDEAAGGEECLELVRKKTYDIIFLDHMMPEPDGIEVLHKMRGWKEYPCKHTPVIALTANAVTGAREMYLEEGFRDFLSKPVNPEKLEKMIMEMLPQEKVEPTEDGDIVSGQGHSFRQEEIDMPELEGVDWNYARLYCKDLSILKNTLYHFYHTIESEAAKLEGAMELLGGAGEQSQAFKKFRVQVHSMKNSAAMIGAVSLAGVAKFLESAAREEEENEIKYVAPIFLREWRKMKETLQEAVEEVMAEGKEEPDYGLIREFLRLLREAMEEMDVDAADEIVKELKRFAYPNIMMEEALENLCLAVADLDQGQAEVWISKLEQELR